MDALIQANALDKLFARLNEAITKEGDLPMSGQIIDATLIAPPKPPTINGEKDATKTGKSADEIWPDELNKAAQKDTPARWTVKRNKAPVPGPDGKTHPTTSIPVFGYKDHIGDSRWQRFRDICEQARIYMDRGARHVLWRKFPPELNDMAAGNSFL